MEIRKIASISGEIEALKLKIWVSVDFCRCGGDPAPLKDVKFWANRKLGRKKHHISEIICLYPYLYLYM